MTVLSAIHAMLDEDHRTWCSPPRIFVRERSMLWMEWGTNKIVNVYSCSGCIGLDIIFLQVQERESCYGQYIS